MRRIFTLPLVIGRARCCHPVYKGGDTHMSWNFRKTSILHTFKDKFWKIASYFVFKQGQFCCQKYPLFTNSRTHQKIPLFVQKLGHNSKDNISNLISPTLTSGQCNDFIYENSCIMINCKITLSTILNTHEEKVNLCITPGQLLCNRNTFSKLHRFQCIGAGTGWK